MNPEAHPLLILVLIAVLAPLIAELPLPFRIPGVVLEIGFGILVGPQVLGWVRAEGTVEVLSKVGLCLLFLLAGIEIDFTKIRGRPLGLAVGGWVCSLALGLGTAFLLCWLGLGGGGAAALLVTLALTTTAIGTLLPILRDAGELSNKFGILTLAAGAMGEFGPLLFLSLVPLAEGRTIRGNALVVAAFLAVAIVAALLVVYVQPRWLRSLLQRHLYKTSQLPVRLTVLLVGALAVYSMELGLEFLIGAFAAGLIVGLVSRGHEAEPFHHKLDGLSFGFLIPIFFVVTGVRFDLEALLASRTSLLCVPLFLGLFLLIRGLPVFLYRRDLGARDGLALAFYSAAALPVVVAITQVGVETKQMEPGIAAALVGAGMISLLLFPQIATALRSGRRPTPASGTEQPGEVVSHVRLAADHPPACVREQGGADSPLSSRGVESPP